MSLFKVNIEFETVINAESEEDAEKQAESVIKSCDDPASSVVATPIKELKDLPCG